MKKLALGLLFLIASVTGYSQKIYFIYLQTEGEQPFFVKMNERVYSSSASGYLVLSRLKDSTYNFSIGFPQNKWPESKYSVTLNRKDHGFLVKNFGEKGWGLFDLQTLAVQMPVAQIGSREENMTVEEKEVSPFTEILSKAANDPSLKIKTEQRAEEKKAEIATTEIENNAEKINEPEVKKEESKAVISEPIQDNKEEPKDEIVKNIEPATEELYKQSVITKKSESSTTEGFGLVFIDNYGNGIADTVRLLIPNPKPLVSIIKEQPKEEKKFLDITIDSANKVETSVQLASQEKVVQDNNVVNKECISQANNNDFLELRKVMAAAESDDDMILKAKRYFRNKCFTTVQIKNLSVLFLDEAPKYKFFDAAYKYVVDPANFNSLQKELKDDYYIARFRTILRN